MSRVLRLRLMAALAMAAVALSACVQTATGSERIEPESQYPQLQTYPDIRVTENVVYGTAGGQPLLLDVCHPVPDDSFAAVPRKAIIVVHGGSWRAGDKAGVSWRSVCQWLAFEGFVAFSVNYRLVPASIWPVQIEDVRSAVAWLRQPAQARIYNIDPDRIGAFGGSAGGHLVSLLGVEGSGDWSSGSRVAAVAELSAPTDLTAAGVRRSNLTEQFQRIELDFLGCEGLGDCPAAEAASPVHHVDESDPPFFVGHSVDEFIPIRQAEGFVAELRDHGIDTTFLTVEGSLHSIALLDDEMRLRIADFFRAKLQ